MTDDQAAGRSASDEVAAGAAAADRRGCTRREGLAALALFSAIALLFFADVLVGNRVLITSDFRWFHPWAEHTDLPAATGFRYDSAQSYFPRRHLSRAALLGGEAPLWNPHAALGIPLLADYQTAPFYPPNLILLPLDAMTAMGAFAFLHVALAGFFMYLFLRDAGVGRVGAAFGALAFQWNGYFVTYEGHPTHIATGIWLPLLLFLVRRALLAPRGFPILLTLALASLFLAGFPQTLVTSCYALAAYTLFVLAVEMRGPLRERAGRAVALFPPIAIAIALAAPELLPSIEMARHSAHEAFTRDSVWTINDIPFVTYLKAVFPDLFGNPIDGTSWLAYAHRGLPHPNDLGAVAYAGVLTPLLAIAGLAALGRRGARRAQSMFFLGLVAVPVLFMSVSPANRLLWRLPGWGFSTELHRVEFLAFVGGSALAAFGLEAALGGAGDRAGSRARRSLVAFGALLVLFLGAFTISGPRLLAGIAEEMVGIIQYAGRGAEALWVTPRMARWISQDVPGWVAHIRGGIVLSVALGTGGVVLVFALVRARAGARGGSAARGLAPLVFAALLLALHAIDVTHAARRYHTPQPRAACYAETEGISVIRAAVRQRPGRLFRFGRGMILEPNIPSVLGLDDAGGYNALLSAEYGEYFNAIEKGAYSRGREVIRFLDPASLDSPLFRLTAARHILVRSWRDAGPLFTDWPFRDVARVRLSPDLRDPGRFGITTAIATRDSLTREGKRVEPTLDEVPAFFWTASGGAAIPLPAGVGDTLAVRWHAFVEDSVMLELAVGSQEAPRVIWSGAVGGPGHAVLGPDKSDPRGWVSAALGAVADDAVLFVSVRMPGGDLSSSAEARKRLLLSQFSVHAGAVSDEASVPHGGLRLKYAGDLVLFESDRALPRLRLVSRAIVEPDRRRALERLASGEIDVESTALIDRAPNVTLDDSAAPPAALTAARIVRETPTRIEIETDAGVPALVILADTNYPGWRAEVDDQPVPILRANALFRAVALPAGPHRVSFCFVSPPYRAGCRAALAALVALPIAALAGRRRARPGASTSAGAGARLNDPA